MFLPFGLGLILIFLGFIFKKRNIFFLGFLSFLFFSMGIVSEMLWRYLENPYKRIKTDEISKSQAIVVLSGSRHPAPGKSKILEWTDPDRFFAGIQLFKKGNAPKLIFTGGYNPHYSGIKGEGEYYTEEAIKLGVPKSAITTTELVSNTLEESLAVKKVISKNFKIGTKKTQITLVTSAFHMKRAKKIFERQGLVVEAFPVDFKSKGSWSGKIWKDPLLWVPNSNSLESSSKAVRELIGRIVYRLW